MQRGIVGLIILLCMIVPYLSIASVTPPDLCAIDHPSDELIGWECRVIEPGDTPLGVFGLLWQDGLRFNRMDQRHFVTGMSLKVPLNSEQLAGFNPMPALYPEAESEPKFILIDLAEQYLGAYEYGRLAFSLPVATGKDGFQTPAGEFRIDAYDRNHTSNLYKIEELSTPYPMFYALRFYVDPKYVAYWIHGRDMPGLSASHGCIGLSNERMQKLYYGEPRRPVLEDARKLYEWAIGSRKDDGRFHRLKNGPRLLIVNNQSALTEPNNLYTGSIPVK